MANLSVAIVPISFIILFSTTCACYNAPIPIPTPLLTIWDIYIKRKKERKKAQQQQMCRDGG